MMRTIVLARIATQDIEKARAWWSENHSEGQANRWYARLSAAMGKIAATPERYGIASESGFFAYEVRQALFGVGRRPSHRVIYTLRGDDQVVVLRVRHVAQDDLTPDDFE